MPTKKSHSISVFLNQEYPSIVKSDGIYLYDDTGKRYMDASSGPILCSLGYGNEEIANVLKVNNLRRRITMDILAAKELGAALAIGLGTIGPGIGIGLIGY